MCLKKLLDPAMTDNSVFMNTSQGYKVFAVRSGELFNIYYGKNKAVPIGVQVNSRDYGRIETVDVIKHENINYPAGFHIFENALDAASFVYDIKKFLWRSLHLITYIVQYGDVTAAGVDDKDRIIVVAREITLLREHVKCL